MIFTEDMSTLDYQKLNEMKKNIKLFKHFTWHVLLFLLTSFIVYHYFGEDGQNGFNIGIVCSSLISVLVDFLNEKF